MSQLAIIGGTGFAAMPDLEIVEVRKVTTRWGDPSAPLIHGRLAGQDILFLARHGEAHSIPPHRINYRANIQALSDAGIDRIIGLAAVGGIAAHCAPLVLAVPDNLIDYTQGRDGTFHDEPGSNVVHIDFSWPFSAPLRRVLLRAARDAGIDVHDGGVYAVTQGPRLETVAEIGRLERDGCDIVGMTAMPEAALARERGIDYATLAFVVNWAAGKCGSKIGMDEINANLDRCAHTVMRLLQTAVGLPADT
jgi:5'-deoxy-5'-methylthioadenosine phosphorylase